MNQIRRNAPGSSPYVVTSFVHDNEAVLAEMKQGHLRTIRSMGARSWLNMQVSYINGEEARISNMQERFDEKFTDLVFALRLRTDVSGKIAEALDPELIAPKTHTTYDYINKNASTEEKNYLRSLVNDLVHAKSILADLWSLMDEIMTENSKQFDQILFGDDMLRADAFEGEEDAPGSMYASSSDMAGELRREVERLRAIEKAIR